MLFLESKAALYAIRTPISEKILIGNQTDGLVRSQANSSLKKAAAKYLEEVGINWYQVPPQEGKK